MPRFRMTIEYDGSNYVGWQRQDNGPSVQGAVEKAILALTREPALIRGAGRWIRQRDVRLRGRGGEKKRGNDKAHAP